MDHFKGVHRKTSDELKSVKEELHRVTSQKRQLLLKQPLGNESDLQSAVNDQLLGDPEMQADFSTRENVSQSVVSHSSASVLNKLPVVINSPILSIGHHLWPHPVLLTEIWRYPAHLPGDQIRD